MTLTVDQYDQMIARGAFVGLNKKIELIHGELREKNPAGPVHEDFIDYLNRWSVESTTGTGLVVRVQNSIAAGDSCPEPDIAWLRPKRYRDGRPETRDVLLLIEVSDSTKSYDQGEKLAIYAEHGIVEYWIVDVQQQRIDVYTEPSGDKYLQHNAIDRDQTISPGCRPQASLELSDLFLG